MTDGVDFGRQAATGTDGRPQRAGTLPRPVSYTHLDVYKRQLLINSVQQSKKLGSFQ